MRSGTAARPVRWVTRAGLAVNGVLHLLVAGLAVRVALGRQARADYAGALQAVAAEPFGRPLLALVVAAFTAVVIWRVREAVHGFRYVPDRWERTGKRLFSAGQAAVYTALALLAVRVAAGPTSGTGGEQLTAALLRMPGGRLVVVVAGAVIVVVGVVTAVQGGRRKFTVDMDLERATPTERAITVRAGQIGAVAKGVAFVIIGVLVVSAALAYRPERAEGLDAALKAIAAQPYGVVGLVAVAVGLACYGVFLFFDARFHRVE